MLTVNNGVSLRAWEATILAFFAESETVAAKSSLAAAPSDSSGAAELGLTVMIGVPLVNFEVHGVAAGEHRLRGDRALLHVDRVGDQPGARA